MMETEKQQTGLERISNVTDAEVESMLEQASLSAAERSAAASAEPEEPAVEEPAVDIDVGEVWGRAIEDDIELLGRESELEEIARIHPELGSAQTEEDALVDLQVAREHLRSADQQAELSEVVGEQAREDALEALVLSEGAMDTVRALDALADRVPIESEAFAEAFELAEGLDPAGAMAFASMLAQAQEAEQAELHAAKEAALDSRASAVIEAVLAETKRLGPALADPAVREVAQELAQNAGTPGSPEAAVDQARLVVGAAQEAVRLDRINAFLSEFDKATAARVPLDTRREELAAELAAQRPQVDMAFLDRSGPQERLQQFDALFDQRFSPSRELRDGIDQVAAKVRADAKGKQ